MEGEAVLDKEEFVWRAHKLIATRMVERRGLIMEAKELAV